MILIDGDMQSRQRLAELLAAHTDFCIVASCATIEAALGALERGPVDMALLDVDLPDCDAKHFIREFRQRCGTRAFAWRGPGVLRRNLDILYGKPAEACRPEQ